jgi:protease PrsW
MAGWSMPIRPPGPTPRGPSRGWKLRALTGRALGKEFDLPLPRYVLGSRSPANIVISDPSIAPQHVTIELFYDHVRVSDCSGGRGLLVNGKRVAVARVAPGDHLSAGIFEFEFSNPHYHAPAAGPGSVAAGFARLPLSLRVGLVTLVVALLLYGLLAISDTPTLVPVTLLALAAVVPVTTACFLLERFDRTGISFFSLTVTFLSGGTVGIISVILLALVGEQSTGGLLLLPVFAGVLEEPGKLLGTAWRWRHPRYDRPMDGLLLGTVSGLGFAMMETAGYGYATLHPQPDVTGSYEAMLGTMVVRGLLSPFAHGLWTGTLAAAFWQCGRNLGRALGSRVFWAALGWAVGLHALWNLGGMLQEAVEVPALAALGYGLMLASAALGVWTYRQLLLNQGYRR